MKHLYITFLLSLFMSMVGLKAQAYDCEIDGIYYNLDSSTKTAVVTYDSPYYNNSYTGDVVIPASITYNGQSYSVISIGNGAFRDCSGLTSITIPNNVTSIGASAFYQCI